MSLNDRGLVDYLRKQSNGEPSSAGVATLDQLMILHDDAFVDAAFKMVLNRPADEAGLAYYGDRLRRGFCRISVLHQLTRSLEARPDWQTLPGLSAAIGRFRKSRRPSGWKLALKDPELGITASLRRARILQNSLGAQRQILAHALHKIEADSQYWRETTAQSSPGPTNMAALFPASARFDPPQARRIQDMRSVDLPDHIKAVVGLLHL